MFLYNNKYKYIIWLFVFFILNITFSCICRDENIIKNFEYNLTKLKQNKSLPTESQVFTIIQNDLNLVDADFKLVDSTGGSFNETYESYNVKKENIEFNLILQGTSVQISDKNFLHNMVEIQVNKITISYSDGKKFICNFIKQ